jgi:hypothetical protein
VFAIFLQETKEEDEVNVLVVEYTKQRVYLGVEENGYLTYCKAPIGKVHQCITAAHFQENAYTLNDKDRQQFGKDEKQYLIYNFSCVMSEGKLKLSTKTCEDISAKVQMYFRQQQ